MLTVVDTEPDIFGFDAVRKVWPAASADDDDDDAVGPTGPNANDGGSDNDDLSAAVCGSAGGGVNDLLAPCIACGGPFGVTERVVFDALFERGLPGYSLKSTYKCHHLGELFVCAS